MLLSSLKRFYKSGEKVKQSVLLFGVTLFNIPISIVSNIVITNYLGVDLFGDFTLLISIFNFAIVIFSFGIFEGGNRLLVLNDDEVKSRNFFGVLLICFFCLFIFMSLCLTIYGLFDSNLESKDLVIVFLVLIPFGWLFLLPNFYESLLHADNKINELAISRFIIVFGHLVFYLVAYFFFTDLHYNRLFLILISYLLTNVIVFVYLIKRLRPIFHSKKVILKKILYQTKKFGFNVYLGTVFGVGISHLSGILISYFSLGNEGVGFYSLAIAFCSPLKLLPNTIATSYYKNYSSKREIPKKQLHITLIFSIVALLILWGIIKPFVLWFYGEQFSPVIRLTYVASLGMLLHGLADFYNRFLGAHGKGKYLRNGAILVGVFMLIGNLVLIPLFSELGCVLAFSISGLVYFISMYYYYYKNRIENSKLLD